MYRFAPTSRLSLRESWHLRSKWLRGLRDVQISHRVNLREFLARANPSVFAGGESSSPFRGAFLALPPGELAFARQMTERAKQFANSVLGKLEQDDSQCQPSLSLRDISPRGKDKFGVCERLTFLISNAILSIEKGHTDRRLPHKNVLHQSNPPYVAVRRITFCLS